MYIRDKNREIALTESQRLYALIDADEPHQAISGARALHQQDPHDLNINIMASAILIDAGTASSDVAAIQEGARLVEKLMLVVESNEEQLIQARYNLSNAYGGLHFVLRRNGDLESAESNLQRQKEALQQLLLRRQHVPTELLPRIMTNYANTLDHLNRIPEAIDAYLDCLEIEPNHGLARANCGVAMLRFLELSEQHFLNNLNTAWGFLDSAVEEPKSITEWAGEPALHDVRQKRDRLRSEIDRRLEDGLSTLKTFQLHRSDHEQANPAPTLEQIVRDRLLLTFNAQPSPRADDSRDDAYFDSLRFSPSEESRQWSVNLINVFNSIKEDYASARYLFYHSYHETARLDETNSLTDYGDPEGSAEFGLLSGLLKTSFRLAVDLLDKISIFIKLYLALPGNDRSCSFNTVWFKDFVPKTGEMNPLIELRLEHNFPLRGLRDIQRDGFRQEYPARTRDARNALVHRWVTLHWLPVARHSSGPESWSLEDFAELTRFMLRQAKGAILLLTAAVNVEERRRAAEQDDKLALPQPLRVRKPISSRAADESYEEPEKNGDDVDTST